MKHSNIRNILIKNALIRTFLMKKNVLLKRSVNLIKT